MSSTYGQCYHYPDQTQLLVASNAFGYGQYESQRSKTPTSLINHSGHSPGPLSTPPLSRNTSQPPEQPAEQPPDQMIWEDGGGSLSDSPTSVRTPDDERFEVDMLGTEDVRTLYQGQNDVLVSTQVSPDSIPAMDSAMLFPDQTIRDPYNATLASQPQQYYAAFNLPNQSSQTMLSSQPYNHVYGQNYTSQPPRHDPWTSQRPPQNPNIPRSGIAVFDPASDPVDYSAYVNFDVDNWTNNHTDPNYLISPSEPLAPPQDNLFQFAHQRQQTHQHHRALEMRVTVPSPPPQPTSHTFVNYNQSSPFFTDDYAAESHFPPTSPGTSLGSSVGQLSQSPYHAAISPHSAPSPGGSEGIFSSYQHSDSGMMADSYGSDPFDMKPGASASPAQFEHSPPWTTTEGTFDTSPEPESQARSQSGTKGSGRPGGRALGTHLEPKVAKAAHDMRKIVACWHCVLQRDKCGPGDVCERCLKRSQRPNADCGLGCSRVKLIELSSSFLPTVLTQMHEDAQLTHFVSQYIHQWGNVEITIYMTCGAGMPRIPVKVYEFVPKGNELLVQIQYRTDPVTHKRFPVKNQSPALGMVHINHNEEKKYDKYLTDIVDNHLDAFGELCWMEDDNDFQQKLFRLMTRVKPKSDDEAKLLREVFRLVVVTFIMSHTLTMAEDTKHQSLAHMHSYNGQASNFTSPRMTNRQLKYFFSRLQRSIMSTVLNKLQQIFKSSKGCDKWLLAFVAVTGMCMAHEDQQKTVHLVMETKAATEGWDRRDAQARADITCREIDARTSFIAQIFRWKYNRKCNPLRDADHDWDREVGFGDESSVTFVRQVSQLVKENIDFLQVRQNVSISPANQTKYTSRLVGQFLLSFWLPQ